MDYPAARGFLAAETPTGTYQIKTGFVRGALTAAGVDTMVEWVSKIRVCLHGPRRALRGFIAGAAKSMRSLLMRQLLSIGSGPPLQRRGVWEPEDDPALIAANLEWLDGFIAAMQPHLSGGAYQNFTDRTLPNWQQEYLRREHRPPGRREARLGPQQPFPFPTEHSINDVVVVSRSAPPARYGSESAERISLAGIGWVIIVTLCRKGDGGSLLRAGLTVRRLSRWVRPGSGSFHPPPSMPSSRRPPSGTSSELCRSRLGPMYLSPSLTTMGSPHTRLGLQVVGHIEIEIFEIRLVSGGGRWRRCALPSCRSRSRPH